MTDKQIIIGDYFTATLTLPEKIVEYQLKACMDNQLVDKINEQNSYLERKEQKLKKIEEFRHNYCMNCEDLLNPSHSCCGCNMSILRHLIEE